MLDSCLLPLQQRLLDPPARQLARLGISADGVTIAGFLIGLGALPLLAGNHFAAALGCILANRLLDGIDGPMARQSCPTDRGAFLDVALDFVFYAAVPFGFALADPAQNALPAAGLLLAFVGTGSSFLAFAAIAAGRGLRSTAYPKKGLFYLGGLTEGTETIVFFIAICLFPAAFPTLAWIFAGLCVPTTVTRWWWGYQAFGTK